MVLFDSWYIMGTVRDTLRSHPKAAATVGTIVGYVLVIGTFLDVIPIYPTIDLTTSTMLSHAIAVVNALTIVALTAGWYWIKSDRIRLHRAAMVTAFLLILLFLVLYLTRVGGGGTKHFVGPDLITTVYQIMLAVHILLSIAAVPLVLYALILGLTKSTVEIRRSRHATIGRLAVATWLLSLLLGLVTYLMLEHLYEWEYVLTIT